MKALLFATIVALFAMLSTTGCDFAASALPTEGDEEKKCLVCITDDNGERLCAWTCGINVEED